LKARFALVGELVKNANADYCNYAKNFTFTAAGAVSSMQLGNGKFLHGTKTKLKDI